MFINLLEVSLYGALNLIIYCDRAFLMLLLFFMFSLMPSSARQTQAAGNTLWAAFTSSFLLWYSYSALELTAAAANYYVYRCTVNATKITTHLTGDGVKTASLKILQSEQKGEMRIGCLKAKKKLPAITVTKDAIFKIVC